MHSSLAKVLHPVGGKPLLKHVIDTSRSLEPREIYVVVGHDSEQIKRQFVDPSLIWVEQA